MAASSIFRRGRVTIASFSNLRHNFSRFCLLEASHHEDCHKTSARLSGEYSNNALQKSRQPPYFRIAALGMLLHNNHKSPRDFNGGLVQPDIHRQKPYVQQLKKFHNSILKLGGTVRRDKRCALMERAGPQPNNLSGRFLLWVVVNPAAWGNQNPD